jgi:nucleoside-diphosphate-sugar epimerase
MLHNILITGGSGYLGGTLIASLESVKLPAYNKLYALVRTDKQADSVRQYNAEPMTIDLSDPSSITSSIVDNKITIVFHLFDAVDIRTPEIVIKALAQVKAETGNQTHFVFTTGAKLFSEFAAAPTDRVLLDTDPNLYEIHKKQEKEAPFPIWAQGTRASNLIVETAEKYGVRSYIFIPCIVYGRGLGFGNPISIQTVAIVKAAKATRTMYKVDQGKPRWPVSHVLDNTSLYIELLRAMLEGRDIGHGKRGYYLASSGRVAWDDIYEAMAKALKARGVIDDENLKEADDEALEKMSEVLGWGKDFVRVHVGGL